MIVPSPNEQIPDIVHFADMEHILLIQNRDTLVGLLSYFEDILAFLQHFNPHTNVHELKAFFTLFEQKADNNFCFLFHQSSTYVCLSADTHSHFSIQYGKQSYGTLYVRKQTDRPEMPAFPLKLAHNLSRLCGWLLYTCEQSMVIWSYPQSEFSTNDTLTKREREVLLLMCHGYELEDIARALNITLETVNKCKKHIYSQSEVYNKRDASYYGGLVAFLDGFYEWRS